jgi:hypothetical protein
LEERRARVLDLAEPYDALQLLANLAFSVLPLDAERYVESEARGHQRAGLVDALPVERAVLRGSLVAEPIARASVPTDGRWQRGLTASGFSMHLVGQLSNLSAPLAAVFEILPDEPITPTRPPESCHPTTGRLGNGVVQRAVVRVLAATDAVMRGADIHRAVERLLEHPVSKDSVSWCLASGVRGKEPRFERVAYGRYRLRRS